MLQNNQFSTNLMDEKHTKEQMKQTRKLKSGHFLKKNYIGKHTKYITKIFRKTNSKVAYKRNNAIQKLLKPKAVNTRTNIQTVEHTNLGTPIATTNKRDKMKARCEKFFKRSIC